MGKSDKDRYTGTRLRVKRFGVERVSKLTSIVETGMVDGLNTVLSLHCHVPSYETFVVPRYLQSTRGLPSVMMNSEGLVRYTGRVSCKESEPIDGRPSVHFSSVVLLKSLRDDRKRGKVDKKE